MIVPLCSSALIERRTSSCKESTYMRMCLASSPEIPRSSESITEMPSPKSSHHVAPSLRYSEIRSTQLRKISISLPHWSFTRAMQEGKAKYVQSVMFEWPSAAVLPMVHSSAAILMRATSPPTTRSISPSYRPRLRVPMPPSESPGLVRRTQARCGAGVGLSRRTALRCGTSTSRSRCWSRQPPYA